MSRQELFKTGAKPMIRRINKKRESEAGTQEALSYSDSRNNSWGSLPCPRYKIVNSWNFGANCIKKSKSILHLLYSKGLLIKQQSSTTQRMKLALALDHDNKKHFWSKIGKSHCRGSVRECCGIFCAIKCEVKIVEGHPAATVWP